MRKLICIVAAAAIGASGQTQLDLRTQSKGADFSGINPTKPIQTGGVLPASCTIGQMFFKSNAASGQNLYGCVATNTWAVQSQGGGAGGSVTINNSGTLVGSRSTIDFSSGLGILTTISDTGQAISVQPSVDTAVIPTRTSEQSGSVLLCSSTSNSGVSYTCAMTPSLTSYTAGMVLRWKPDVNGTGGATTLNVDTLGAVNVKLSNGANPAAGDLVAGRIQEIWYDGVNFRFLNSIVDTSVLQTRAGEQSGGTLLCASASGSGLNYTCAMTPSLTNYTSGMALRWKPDVNGTGGATTLKVDALGVVNVKLSNGANPAAGDIVAGRIQEIWYDGVNFRFLNSIVDTTLLQSRAGEQSGSALLCASAGGSGVSYTCAMTPALTSYTSGMTLRWKPDVNGSGGATTLNVDGLGAVSVKLANGSSNPVPGDLMAGRIQEIWHDGANFRFLTSIVPAGVLGETRPTCNAAVGGRLWFIAGASGVKDGLSVCAKDAGDAFAWRTLY